MDPGLGAAEEHLLTTRPEPPRWRRLLPLVGLALVVVVLARLDRRAMLEALAEIRWQAIGLAVVVFLINVLLKAVRWQRMLRAQEIVLGRAEVLAAFLAGAFYGAVTIGRIGEFLRADVLVRSGVPIGRAMSSCVFDRILDLLTLVVIGGVFGASILGDTDLAVGAAVVAAIVVGLGWLAMRRAVRWAQASSAGGTGTTARIRTGLRDLIVASPALLRPGPLVESLAWTIAGWAFHFAAVWVLAWGLHLQVPLWLLTAATAVAALTVLLPITFQGIGTREVIFAVVLGPAGVAPETAVLLALLTVTVSLGTTIGAGMIGVIARR